MVTMAQKSRLYICGLAVLALLLQALVPAGFMPSFSPSRVFHVEICTASGFSTVAVKTDKTPFGGKHGKDAHPSCPYAPVLSHALAARQDVFVPVFVQAILAVAAIVFPPLSAAKSWLSRAPPLSLRR